MIDRPIVIPDNLADRRGKRDTSVDKDGTDPSSPSRKSEPKPDGQTPSLSNPKKFTKRRSLSFSDLEVIRDIERKFEGKEILVDTDTAKQHNVGMMKKKAGPSEIESPIKEYHHMNEKSSPIKIASHSELPESKKNQTNVVHKTMYSGVKNQAIGQNISQSTYSYSNQSTQPTGSPTYTYTKDANGNYVKVMRISRDDDKPKESPIRSVAGTFKVLPVPLKNRWSLLHLPIDHLETMALCTDTSKL